MVATRLSLYNEALRLVGERSLGSLTENREPRRLLDQVWDTDVVRTCLEQGTWNFALRAVELAYDASVSSQFGYRYAFARPDDFVRLAQFGNEPTFAEPWLHYGEEGGYFFADLENLYLRYVSDDDQYGRDLSLWPASFTRYVAAHMATEIVNRLTQSGSTWDALLKLTQRRLADALTKDAISGPTQFLPAGSWVRARGGWGSWGRGRRGEHG